MGRNGANDAKIHGGGGLCETSFWSKFRENRKENKHRSMGRNGANEAKIYGAGGLCETRFCSKFGENPRENKNRLFDPNWEKIGKKRSIVAWEGMVRTTLKFMGAEV